MSEIDKCCLNCAYFKIGWCDLQGIVPYPPDKIDCVCFAPKPIKLDCVAKNKETAKQTVFDKITESVEALAKEFVAEFSIYGGRSYWCSLLLAEIGHSVFEQRFNTKEEAIATTIEELKKEYKK